MKFQSNAKWCEKKEEGTVFRLVDNDLNVSVHRIIHIDDTWFLSCHVLGISRLNLYESDFKKAVGKSKAIINKKLGELMAAYDKMCSDDEIEIV